MDKKHLDNECYLVKLSLRQQKKNMENSKLTRTEEDKVVAGVCGGLARYFGMDSTLFRIIFVLCTIFGVGSPFLIYLVLAVIMPKDNPYGDQPYSFKDQ